MKVVTTVVLKAFLLFLVDEDPNAVIPLESRNSGAADQLGSSNFLHFYTMGLQLTLVVTEEIILTAQILDEQLIGLRIFIGFRASNDLGV